jgi:hypothetical protein
LPHRDAPHIVPVMSARRALNLVVLAALALLSACGGSSSSGGSGGSGGVDLPKGTWTWVDVSGAVCSDGSGTGIGVNRGDSDQVVFFLDGGGACWDTLTCFTLHAADPGPFGRTEFEARIGKVLPGSIFDRTLPGNPYANATLVFVPYCTGDVHAGDAVQSYPGAPRPWHHKGRPNLVAAVGFVAGALPSPSKVVVSGSSAGGFGSLFAFDLVRQQWPASRGYLVDDSGPPLVGDDFDPVLRAAWFASWRLDLTLLPLCPGCAHDLSQLFPTLAGKYPADRLGLLSSRQDLVIRTYVLLGPAEFEAALLRLVDEVMTPIPTAGAFLVPGASHTMLGHPNDFTAGDVNLVEWLRRQVEDDPSWKTEGR